jgi:hypothetical protein
VLLALAGIAFWVLRRSGRYNLNPPETQESLPRLIMVNRRAEEGVSHGREQLVVIQIDSDSDEGEGRVRCEICGLTFACVKSALIHMLEVHLEDRPHLCPNADNGCPWAFKRKSHPDSLLIAIRNYYI